MRVVSFIVGFGLFLASPCGARTHCMLGLSDAFAAAQSRIMNREQKSTSRSLFLGRFSDSQDVERIVSLVEESYPFAPGYRSKKLYRQVLAAPMFDPLVAPSPEYGPEVSWGRGFNLVKPITRFVYDNEKHRRKWGPQIYQDLKQVSVRYFPESVYFWIEEERSHRIVAAARVIHAPFPPSSDRFGYYFPVEDLHGSFDEMRDPFSKDFNFRQGVARVPPPSIVPLEHILKLRVNRGAFGVVSEAGCYSVDKVRLDKYLQKLAVHEMSLQISREMHRFRYLGREFMKNGALLLSWADPTSHSIYSLNQGAQDFHDYEFTGDYELDEEGLIKYAGTGWKVIKWSGEDRIRENLTIIEDEHVRFDSNSSLDRREALFVPNGESDGALHGAFKLILRLLHSKDDLLFIGALDNLVDSINSLAQISKGRETIDNHRPELEKLYASLVQNANGTRLYHLINHLHPLYLKHPNLAMRQSVIRSILIRAALSEDRQAREFALMLICDLIRNKMKMNWPINGRPPELGDFVDLRVSLGDYFMASPTVAESYLVKFNRVVENRDSALRALESVRGELTEETLDALIHVASKDASGHVSLTFPLEWPMPLSTPSSDTSIGTSLAPTTP